jgi:hypothetical protein
LLALLEPFALDLWRHEIVHWLPAAARKGWRKQSVFGGLYQKVVITRQSDQMTRPRAVPSKHLPAVKS